MLVEQKEESLEVNSMLTNRPKAKMLVDGGDPNETLRIKSLVGFVGWPDDESIFDCQESGDSIAHRF
jgi:hypothetical protein